MIISYNVSLVVNERMNVEFGLFAKERKRLKFLSLNMCIDISRLFDYWILLGESMQECRLKEENYE